MYRFYQYSLFFGGTVFKITSLLFAKIRFSCKYHPLF